MSQKSEEGETTYSHYLHGLLSEKERKGKKKKGPPAFDLIKINEPRHAYFFNRAKSKVALAAKYHQLGSLYREGISLAAFANKRAEKRGERRRRGRTRRRSVRSSKYCRFIYAFWYPGGVEKPRLNAGCFGGM